MSLWAYKAYEDQYCGGNGIVTYGIVEGNEGLAHRAANEAACELLEGYEFIMNELEEDAEYNGSSIEFEMQDRIVYELCELDPALIAGRDIRELDEQLNDIGFDDFQERYGIK